LKTPILTAAIVAFALTAPVASAQDQAAPAQPAMGMDAQMSQMHANMAEMQAQMEKIHATTNPKERRKLMQAHMQTMQESMAMMESMSKPMIMDGGQPGGMAMGGDMMKHHQMMQERMGMMTTMMQQMLDHLQVMESMPAK